MDDLTFREYNADDYPLLESWWKEWSMTPTPKEFLPKTGLVAMSGSTPIAAAFLLNTDSAGTYVESLVSNPSQPSYLRGRAVVLLVLKLLEEAKRLGYRAARVLTVKDSVAALTKALGGFSTDWVVLEGPV